MSRPVKGYTVHRKIKSAKKSIVHLNTLLKDAKEEDVKTKLSDRIKFWEAYIVKMTPDPKAPKTKK